MHKSSEIIHYVIFLYAEQYRQNSLGVLPVSFHHHSLRTYYAFFIVLNYHVTVQYLHSYDAKSIPNRLRRWDFALLNHFLTVSAVNASTCTE